MVPYDLIEITAPVVLTYIYEPDFDSKHRYQRVISSLNTFIQEGRPVYFADHINILNHLEMEEYRKEFCCLAKRLSHNIIYLDIPVIISDYESGSVLNNNTCKYYLGVVPWLRKCITPHFL